MSVEAFTWALRQPVGGSPKVVLLGIANHAHPDGGEAYPSLDTLATYAHCNRSTARRNIRKLEEDGWIIRDGVGPRGELKWRLPLGSQNATGGKMPRVASGTERGTTQVPPEPKEPSNRQKDASALATDAFPEDLPAELEPIAVTVGKLLKRVALDRQQKKPVTRAAVGHAVLTYPDRDHERVAREVEHWLLHGKGARRSCADIVSRYRSFLANSDPAPGPPLPGAEPRTLHALSPREGRRAEREALRLQEEAALRRIVELESNGGAQHDVG
jgi:hypothetical protein